MFHPFFPSPAFWASFSPLVPGGGMSPKRNPPCPFSGMRTLAGINSHADRTGGSIAFPFAGPFAVLLERQKEIKKWRAHVGARATCDGALGSRPQRTRATARAADRRDSRAAGSLFSFFFLSLSDRERPDERRVAAVSLHLCLSFFFFPSSFPTLFSFLFWPRHHRATFSFLFYPLFSSYFLDVIISFFLCTILLSKKKKEREGSCTAGRSASAYHYRGRTKKTAKEPRASHAL